MSKFIELTDPNIDKKFLVNISSIKGVFEKQHDHGFVSLAISGLRGLIFVAESYEEILRILQEEDDADTLRKLERRNDLVMSLCDERRITPNEARILNCVDPVSDWCDKDGGDIAL